MPFGEGAPSPKDVSLRTGESPLREKDIDQAHDDAVDSEAYRFLAKSVENDTDLATEEREERSEEYMRKAESAEFGLGRTTKKETSGDRHEGADEYEGWEGETGNLMGPGADA